MPAAPLVATAVGVNPTRWFRIPTSWVEYQVRVRERDTAPVVLFEQRLNPHPDAADRRWVDTRIDLSAYAGRRITLELTAQCENASGLDRKMGGFEVPRLVGRRPTALAPSVELWQARSR